MGRYIRGSGNEEAAARRRQPEYDSCGGFLGDECTYEKSRLQGDAAVTQLYPEQAQSVGRDRGQRSRQEWALSKKVVGRGSSWKMNQAAFKSFIQIGLHDRSPNPSSACHNRWVPNGDDKLCRPCSCLQGQRTVDDGAAMTPCHDAVEIVLHSEVHRVCSVE
ncbi:hypothetical protein A0H81_06528 [Grifola frondosa]|uniref:Uncharacterized protein n=1 Tax=Grifola frondosa TaxID=5627 RepID=A0A1C7M9Q5_GRIFR|nr:hypothetical protein A0H81_06528 [Grifola frondosa]